MNQMALPLGWPADERQEDFIVGESNARAVKHLEHWGTWPVMATLLVGPRKSGRSLLGRLFARKSGGRLIDDADRRPEEELFHAWNGAQESHKPLLIVADEAPPAWKIRLPDLRTRLSATPVISLGDPDDALAARLIEKLLLQRNLQVPPGLVPWLMPRIERTHIGIIQAVDALDEAALAKRVRLSIKLARDTFAAKQEDLF
ncbi:chromosomal replication initiator DnaA [Sphingomonas sp. MAH-20]|uniref:Chromosomal replication initiator DnaA n=1 Tax=Sphingomonas horti TaxID=2682842 RepID=A0A6I4J1V5_9SPHN|nr:MULTISPECIES: DnaA/Hda family protein [Sphingomonas]MBA2919405.1 chromosomal replication initiator DnaA [Sphingomonas sp. CGMCC 1.13658]MVO78286.1 chromosomal replication initiator DnaA [Sphingomonas horti]